MGRTRIAGVVALSLLAPVGAFAATSHRAPPHRAEPAAAARRPVPRAKARPARPGRPTLAEAKAAMTALMRDRSKRRLHHNWERAIRDLQRAARGKDAPAATLEAARARYALYRWSANEADREEALRLAARAE